MNSGFGRSAAVAISGLLLTAMASGCAVTSVRPPDDDMAVTGPAWKTTVRRGPGAATAADPARLTGVAVEDHERYDRVVFTFDGERPGYQVAYGSPADQDGDPVLRITLTQAHSEDERHLSPELPTVREVRQSQGTAGVVETVVIVAARTDPDAARFRVGLSVGEFYVDLAHADEAS
jgi:hypothetical protein